MERLVAGRVIRAGRREDLDALERLENAAFETDRLSRRSLRRFLGAVATTGAFVAEDGTGLLGYAMIGFRKGSDTGRVFSLAVDAGALRQGVGGELLRACEAAARQRDCLRLRLEVRSDNEPAIRLYERVGFRPAGLRSDYYEDGASALLFEKAIAPSGGAAPSSDVAAHRPRP